MRLRNWFKDRVRGGPRLQCAVVTPIGPGHEGLYSDCRESIKAAWRADRGPFTGLQVVPVDDSDGQLGRSRARNRGVREAAAAGADWIFFLDADDLLHAEAFSNVGDLLERHDAVWGLITTQRPDEPEPRFRWPQLLSIDSLEQLVMFDPVITLQMGHFVRTRTALENPFDEALDAGEDFDYYLRLWRNCRCIKVPKTFFVNRRGRHSGGARGATPQQWAEAARERLRIERERLNIDPGSERTVALLNRSVTELQQFCRQHGLANATNYFSLSRDLPYRGIHRIADYAGDPFVMFSDNDDLICASLAWTGEYEYLTSRLWQALAREARVILDVGAYTGFYSLLAARANPAARIHCLEPLAQNFERLKRNLQLNDCTRVHALRAAASARDGSAEINLFGGGDFLTSGASLDARHAVVRTEAVSLIRLDTYLRQEGCHEVDLAKVDVEGHEVEVLEGLRETIVSRRADLIVEATDARREAAVERLLSVQGYRLYRISDANYRIEPLPGRPADPADRNLLATTRSASDVERLVDESLSARSDAGGAAQSSRAGAR